MNERKEKIKSLLMQAYKDLAIDPRDLDTDLIEDFPDEFMYFIGLVEADAVAREREACAKLCDDLDRKWNQTGVRECAAVIRRRTE